MWHKNNQKKPRGGTQKDLGVAQKKRSRGGTKKKSRGGTKKNLGVAQKKRARGGTTKKDLGVA